MLVRISREAVDRMVSHARAEAPLECCGLLIGRQEPAPDDGDAPSADGRMFRVAEVVPTRNLLASATRFEVDPSEHFAAIRRARRAGLSIIGAYHSHPRSAAVPSPTDRSEAAYPDFVYVIVGLPAAEVRSYELVAGNFREVPLVPFS